MQRVIDDTKYQPVVSEVTTSQSGTVRVDGKTGYEHLKEYYAQYGEEEYVDFIISEHIDNPRGIKIKNEALRQRVIDAGLQL